MTNYVYSPEAERDAVELGVVAVTSAVRLAVNVVTFCRVDEPTPRGQQFVALCNF